MVDIHAEYYLAVHLWFYYINCRFVHSPWLILEHVLLLNTSILIVQLNNKDNVHIPQRRKQSCTGEALYSSHHKNRQNVEAEGNGRYRGCVN